MKRWVKAGCLFIVMACMLLVCDYFYTNVYQGLDADAADNQMQESQMNEGQGIAIAPLGRRCFVSLPDGRAARYSYCWPAYMDAQPELEARAGERICSNVYSEPALGETYTVYADLEAQGYAAVLVEVAGIYYPAEFEEFVTDVGDEKLAGILSNEGYDCSNYALQDIFTDIYQVGGAEDIVSIQAAAGAAVIDDSYIIASVYRTFANSYLLCHGIEGLNQLPEWTSDQMKERRSRPGYKSNIALQLHLKNGQAVSVTYDASNGVYIHGDNYFTPLTDKEMELLELVQILFS